MYDVERKENRGLTPDKNVNRNIEGLSFTPTYNHLGEGYDDFDSFDGFPCDWSNGNPSVHFSECVSDKFEEIFIEMKSSCRAVFEIGVWRPKGSNDNSPFSTEIILRNKKNDTKYLGVDIQDRSFVDGMGENIHTIICNSMNRDPIYEKIKNENITEFDFMFIDGEHSVNEVLYEWENYVIPFLSKDGIALFHDVHTHPGPYALFESVNKDIFDVKKYCYGDWGIGSIRRK